MIALATPKEGTMNSTTRRPTPRGLSARLALAGLPTDAKLVAYAVDPDGTAEAVIRTEGERQTVDAPLAASVWGRG